MLEIFDEVLEVFNQILELLEEDLGLYYNIEMIFEKYWCVLDCVLRVLQEEFPTIPLREDDLGINEDVTGLLKGSEAFMGPHII